MKWIWLIMAFVALVAYYASASEKFLVIIYGSLILSKLQDISENK